MSNGTVKWFKDDKGYGFITGDDDHGTASSDPSLDARPKAQHRTRRPRSYRDRRRLRR